MPDYQKGKIYTIRCRDDDTLLYVGSTIQPLSVRFGGHKRAMIQNPHLPLYKNMLDKGVDKFYIELYEDFPCNNKEQLHKREGEITRLIGTVNKRIAGRTQAEYYENNKAAKTEYQKIYWENNKEEIKKKTKEYYNNYKERILEKITCNHCGAYICRVNLERHKKNPICFNVKSPATLDDDDASF